MAASAPVLRYELASIPEELWLVSLATKCQDIASLVIPSMWPPGWKLPVRLDGFTLQAQQKFFWI